MSTRRRYRESDRVRALRVAREFHGNLRAAADLTGIPRTTLQYWLLDQAAAGDESMTTDAPANPAAAGAVSDRRLETQPPASAPTSEAAPDTASADRFRPPLPERLARRLDQTLENHEITSMTQLIGLMDLRIEEVLSGLEIGDSVELWERLREAADLVCEADAEVERERGAPEDGSPEWRRKEMLKRLMLLIDQGVCENAAWDEFVRLAERRRRLSSAETLRRHRDREVFQRSQVIAWQEMINHAIQQHVTDPGTVAAIAETLQEQLRRHPDV